MSGPRFVTAGGMRIDYLITHDGQARLGLVGGNALYSAVGAAVWSDSIGLWSRLGDNYPERWQKLLEHSGLATDGLVRIPGTHDHRTFYAYTSDGQRVDTNPAAHFARINMPLPDALSGYTHSTPGQDDPSRDEPLALQYQDWPAEYSQVSGIHLAPLPIRSHLETPAGLRQQGIDFLTVDPGERYMIPDLLPFIQKILPLVDAFLPSDQEVRSLFGPDLDLAEAAEKLSEWGAPLVVIKCGPDGVRIYERRTDQHTFLPAYHNYGDSRIVDVTGAGDAFCGAFMVGLGETSDPIRASQMGLASASLVIEGYGALSALDRSPGELIKRFESLLG